MITRLFTLLFLVTVVSGQTPAPPEIHVKLSFAEDKTVYRIGEPIRIVLEFSADREGYMLENTAEGNDPISDKILVSPETGMTHWYLELMANGRDYFGYEKLTSSPRRLEITLNDSVRFDNSGRYTVSVTTSRVRKPAKDPYGEPFTMTTNAISFDLQSMSDEDEAKEVKRLSDLLNTARESRAGEPIARQLAYLTGEPSTREKVRRFINSDERTDSYRYTIYTGLFIARNRALVLKLIETALRDPNIPTTSLMLSAACRLKVMLNYGVSERPVGPAIGVLQPQEDPRNREIREGYLTELAAGLGKRTGNSLTTTATTVFTSIWPQSQSDSAGVREARNVLVQQFDTLHPFTQEWLLRMYWNQMRDPLLIPSLKKMLTSTTSVGDKNLHETALLRLLEMAPDDVRPYVIAEIRNPDSFQETETLGKLKDESLPEVDASLLEQIRKFTQSTDNRARVLLRLKTQLLSRFATDRIYGELMQLYQQMGANLPREARPGLLAYFAKYNEREAIPLIEQAVADLKPGEYPQVLSDVTALYYSDAIGALLKKLMDTEDPVMASHAAYLIGVHGSAGNEKLLEARLKSWQDQWRNRVAEADAQFQGQIERELIYALIHGKSWKLSAERVRELQTSCLTQMCKQNNVVSQ